MNEPSDDPFEFAGKLLNLLQYGGFTSTYKYAVLLALMDLCVEFNAQGGAPTSITTVQLAEKVIELYWPQTWPFEKQVLYQTQGRRQAEIIDMIGKWRGKHAQAGQSLARARVERSKAFATLVRKVEWKLVQMPLPKLQRVGNHVDTFVYTIGWSDAVKKSEFAADTFDNRILLQPQAARNLIRTSPLLRPLIHREWAAMVARINDLKARQLEAFLFFSGDQIDLAPVRPGLLELQSCRCFYCGSRIRSEPQVDHFIPRARHPDHGIENLVIAHQRCNGSKNDFIAHTDHLLEWARRLDTSGADLATIAREAGWQRHPGRTINVVRTVYGQVALGTALWRGRPGRASPTWEAMEPAGRRRAFELMAVLDPGA